MEIILAGLMILIIAATWLAVRLNSVTFLSGAGLLIALVMLLSGAIIPAILQIIIMVLLPLLLNMPPRATSQTKPGWLTLVIALILLVALIIGAAVLLPEIKSIGLGLERRIFDWVGLFFILVVAVIGAANLKSGESK